MMESKDNVRLAIWGLTALVVVLFTATAYSFRQTRTTTDRVNRAICAIRKSNTEQVKNTDRYFQMHPDAFKKFGITPADLARSQQLLRDNIYALRFVKC